MKRAHFSCDAERIADYVHRLPRIKVCSHLGRALAGDCPAKGVRAACRAYGVDTSGCFERSDYVGALERMPIRSLRLACKSHGIDTRAFCERREFLDALRGDAASLASDDPCPICMEEYVHGENVCVFLCNHEFHVGCAMEAVRSQFEGTGEMPNCPLCRTPVKWTPGLAEQRGEAPSDGASSAPSEVSEVSAQSGPSAASPPSDESDDEETWVRFRGRRARVEELDPP